MAEALDKIERELGYTLTGPVRELVNTRIVNVLSKSLGVVARDDKGAGGRLLSSCPGTARSRWKAPTTSGPTPPTSRASTSGSWPASATAPNPRLQGRRSRHPEPPAQPPRPEPDPRQVRDQPRRPIERHRHRPDRRGLDRRRLRDRGRHERRGRRRTDSSALRLLNVS